MDRSAVLEHGMEDSPDQIYYTRVTGLFRVCFVQEDRPPSGSPGLFLNTVENWCYERNYGIKELVRGVLLPGEISHFGGVQLHLARSAPCLLVVYLFLMVLAGMIGLSGCWSQSANRLLTTAAIQLLAALVGSVAMAAWHASLFLEMEKVHEAGFPLTWPDWLQEATSVGVGWSYFLAWAGVCLTLLSSLATSASSICLRAERREDAAKMKMWMSSMFAYNRYYPGEKTRTVKTASPVPVSLPVYPPGYVEAATLPAPFPTRARSSASLYSSLSRENIAQHIPDDNTFVDYKKVVGQLENSRFY